MIFSFGPQAYGVVVLCHVECPITCCRSRVECLITCGRSPPALEVKSLECLADVERLRRHLTGLTHLRSHVHSLLLRAACPSFEELVHELGQADDGPFMVPLRDGVPSPCPAKIRAIVPKVVEVSSWWEGGPGGRLVVEATVENPTRGDLHNAVSAIDGN